MHEVQMMLASAGIQDTRVLGWGPKKTGNVVNNVLTAASKEMMSLSYPTRQITMISDFSQFV